MKKNILICCILWSISILFIGCNKTDHTSLNPSSKNKGGTSAVKVDEVKADNKSVGSTNSYSNTNEFLIITDGTENSVSDQSDVITWDYGDSDVIEIREKMFIAQTNDIYLNVDDYLGKIIKLEGLFDFYYEETTDTTYYYVFRYGPGCCGNDGSAGFEVVWDKGYPEIDDWVEAIGILETYEEDGATYLQLRLQELNVLEVRGNAYVEQ